MHTPLTRLLGIQYPVLQAGMGLVARGDLAGAVSEAGGLGCIGSGQLTPQELREEIRRTRRLTSKPFGVDILFARVDAAGPDVDVYSAEVLKQIDIVLEERVPVLVSGLGNPYLMIDDAHAQGMVVLSVVGTVRHARVLVDAGVDGVIGQGHEGGGHTGTVGTSVLIPALVRECGVPVVAAGGMSDGRGLAAALALGAGGVWMGTRFIASQEAFAHENYKRAIVAADDEGTVVTRGHSGKRARLLRNEYTKYWDEHPEKIQPFPLQAIRHGIPASKLARLDGDVVHGSAPAGQGSTNINDVPPAAEVVHRTVDEARSVIQELHALVG